MVSAWGAGAVAGAAIYARWRGRPNRDLIVGGAAFLGLGFVVMAAAPTLAVAIVGAALGGVGNGVESVAARTALQEEASEQWMAMMMSLYEALFQSVPGAGMLIGGGITALGSPRTALAVAGAGSLGVTVAAWFGLTGLGSRHEASADGAPGSHGDAARGSPADAHRSGPRRDAPRTPAVRHQ
jgi:MFS family permease